MDEKTLEYINDITEIGVVSSCCGAPIICEDICSDCKEHCDPINEEEDEKSVICKHGYFQIGHFGCPICDRLK